MLQNIQEHTASSSHTTANHKAKTNKNSQLHVSGLTSSCQYQPETHKKKLLEAVARKEMLERNGFCKWTLAPSGQYHRFQGTSISSMIYSVLECERSYLICFMELTWLIAHPDTARTKGENWERLFSPESLLPTAQPDWTRRCPLTQLFSAQHRTWGHFHTVPGGQCPLQQGRWPLAFAQAQRLAAAGRGHWSDTRQDTYSFKCVLNDKTRNIKELLCFI